VKASLDALGRSDSFEKELPSMAGQVGAARRSRFKASNVPALSDPGLSARQIGVTMFRCVFSAIAMKLALFPANNDRCIGAGRKRAEK
jgi:hypothetical protein